MAVTIFWRTWWDEKGEPQMGEKHYVTTVNTAEEARRYCDEANEKRTSAEKKTGKKFEFTGA